MWFEKIIENFNTIRFLGVKRAEKPSNYFRGMSLPKEKSEAEWINEQSVLIYTNTQ